MLIVAVLILAISLGVAGCQSEQATEEPTQQISIPGVEKPSDEATATPEEAPATDTPAPPPEATDTAYPEPDATAPAPTEAYPAPEDPQALLQARCTQCHGLNRVTSAQKDRESWEETVTRMINLGAEVSPEEKQILVDYLAENYN
jgi:hypothetical protein